MSHARRAPRVAAAATFAALALTACGGGDGDESDAAGATPRPSESAAAAPEEPIVIKTRIDLPTGEILPASTVGGSPFCPGGTFEDEHGTPDVGLVGRTITCDDGTLKIGFDPQTPVGDTQSGPWRIVTGTGAYEGWAGRGDMKTTYDSDDDSEHPTRGRETFRGTVTR